jgi:hypothetical protein
LNFERVPGGIGADGHEGVCACGGDLGDFIRPAQSLHDLIPKGSDRFRLLGIAWRQDRIDQLIESVED